MKSLKIGILGCRGIPNAYGGFEQFAESLSLYLVEKGHEVYVYNSSLHPVKDPVWRGVNRVICNDPENKIGTAGQFIYDLNCILHSRKANYDILLQLGYTSSAIWHWLLPKKSVVITNMDGLEWKRSKYSAKTQKFLKYSEKLAANSSDYLVADSIGIQEYLKKTLNKESTYLAYGAKIFDKPNIKTLDKYELISNQYLMVLARMEPENNIEMILEGYTKSKNEYPIIVIGNADKAYGNYLRSKFNSSGIRFLGAVYNQGDLNDLRYYSKLYFHGHSVGGTNPSLLEAMASSALICAHNNIFNKSILEENALYFKDSNEVSEMINAVISNSKDFKNQNLLKIENEFKEGLINSKYEQLFMDSYQKKNNRQ